MTALMDMLDGVQFENSVAANEIAIRFLAFTGPQVAGFRTSFPFRDRVQLRTFFSNNRSCRRGDCRIDLEVTAGVAFESYLQ